MIALSARPWERTSLMSSGGSEENGVTSLDAPIEEIDGNLTIRIPMIAGGDQFVACSRGISEVRGEYLYVVVDEFTRVMGLQPGEIAHMDNEDGKFNFRISRKPHGKGEFSN